jgi:hypothetical protein
MGRCGSMRASDWWKDIISGCQNDSFICLHCCDVQEFSTPIALALSGAQGGLSIH